MTQDHKQMSGYSKTRKQIKTINDWVDSVNFDKQLIGGVSEKDVWQKFMTLHKMYEDALNMEKIRYEVLLEEYKKRSSEGK